MILEILVNTQQHGRHTQQHGLIKKSGVIEKAHFSFSFFLKNLFLLLFKKNRDISCRMLFKGAMKS